LSLRYLKIDDTAEAVKSGYMAEKEYIA
jgi:hypothetical protein